LKPNIFNRLKVNRLIDRMPVNQITVLHNMLAAG
jgi:hypothetical protein